MYIPNASKRTLYTLFPWRIELLLNPPDTGGRPPTAQQVEVPENNTFPPVHAAQA